MKKVLAILFSVVFVFGCGENNNSTTTTNTDSVSNIEVDDFIARKFFSLRDQNFEIFFPNSNWKILNSQELGADLFLAKKDDENISILFGGEFNDNLMKEMISNLNEHFLNFVLLEQTDETLRFKIDIQDEEISREIIQKIILTKNKKEFFLSSCSFITNQVSDCSNILNSIKIN